MKARLLIADDDTAFIASCHAPLSDVFEVEFASDPKSAMGQLASLSFQVVLISVELAKDQGYGLCAAIRARDALRGLRVVLISARASQAEFARHRSLRGRADGYLFKPIEAATLSAQLQDILGQPLQAEALAPSLWKRLFRQRP